MPPEPSTQMASAGTVPGTWRRDALTADPATRPAPVVTPPEAAPAPTAAPEQSPAPVQQGRRPARVPRRGRRVKRIVRRVELWSVLKLALIFFLCMYAVGLVTLAVLWGLANSAGLVDNFESFAERGGLGELAVLRRADVPRLRGHRGRAGRGGTLLSVLATALVNLISELTGGIRLVVIEEDVGCARARRSRSGPIVGSATIGPVPGAIAQSVRAHP